MMRHGRHTRRRLLLAGSGALVGSLLGGRAALAAAPRVLNFENLHTGEQLRATYWAAGAYLDSELQRIAWVLRDHRTGLTHAIDARLLELLHALSQSLNVASTFQVISGYRTPQSNAMLAATTEGVAHRSLHMAGMAIDIRMPGTPLPRLRDAALALQAGGVGFYPRSDFVHVDVGRVRHW